MDGAFGIRPGRFLRCPLTFSFFDLIDQESLGLNKAPFRRIISLMRKMEVSSLLIEDLPLSGVLKSEVRSIENKLAPAPKKLKARARRFTFSRAAARKDWDDKNILGYLVLVSVKCGDRKFSYVYCAGIRLPCLPYRTSRKQHSYRIGHYYLHSSKAIRTTVGTKKAADTFTFQGNYFHQQNGISSICGHVAFCMAFNNSPHYLGPLIFPHQIANGTHRFDHLDMSSLGHERNFQHLYEEFGSKSREVKYDDVVYPLIESGFPVILGIKHGANSHAVAALGHTLNTDRWSPEARLRYLGKTGLLSSSAWVDHLLLADDNLGPLLALPAKSQDRRTKVHVSFALGFVPAGTKIAGNVVEPYSGLFAQKVINLAAYRSRQFGLDEPSVWMKRLADQSLVLRTILLNKNEYLERAPRLRDQEGNKLSKRELSLLEHTLPNIFWLTEVTIPHLYTANKRKLGEVFTDATATKKEVKNFRALTFGWLAGLRTNLVITPQDYGFSFASWSLRGHVPLFRTRDGEEHRMEW